MASFQINQNRIQGADRVTPSPPGERNRLNYKDYHISGYTAVANERV